MSIAWAFNGIGGVIGAIGGGIFTEYTHPYISFMINSIFGLIVAINCIYLPSEVEEDGEFVYEEGQFAIRILDNYQQIKKAL